MDKKYKNAIFVDIEGLNFVVNSMVWKYLTKKFNKKYKDLFILSEEFPRPSEYSSNISMYFSNSYKYDTSNEIESYKYYGMICDMYLLDIFDWLTAYGGMHSFFVNNPETKFVVFFNGYIYKMMYMLTPKLYSLLRNEKDCEYIKRISNYIKNSNVYPFIPKCDYIIKLTQKKLPNKVMKKYSNYPYDNSGFSKSYIEKVNSVFTNYSFDKEDLKVITINIDDFKDPYDIAKYIINDNIIKLKR